MRNAAGLRQTSAPVIEPLGSGKQAQRSPRGEPAERVGLEEGELLRHGHIDRARRRPRDPIPGKTEPSSLEGELLEGEVLVGHGVFIRLGFP